MTDGAVEPTESGFVDDFSPGKHPTFICTPNMNPKLYFYLLFC